MFKSIEEIAREDGWSEADSYFDDVLAFGEIVRRSDRQHWLEVACKAVCVWCRAGLVSKGGLHHDPTAIDEPDKVACAAYELRSAFTAQEKNNG